MVILCYNAFITFQSTQDSVQRTTRLLRSLKGNKRVLNLMFSKLETNKGMGGLLSSKRKREEQIFGTMAESQQIVVQRLLSCLQYHAQVKSSTKDLIAWMFQL